MTPAPALSIRIVSPGRAALRALRLHQWTKNILVLVPLVLSHRVAESAPLIAGLIACACFSLSASALYVINDLFDISSDRTHPRKRNRPFAAGDLSLRTGFTMAAVLGAASWGLAILLPDSARTMLGAYWVATIAYSMHLKRMLFVDVVMLAGFYTVRLLFGGAAMGITISVWTLAFSMFIFLSLALVKRSAELAAAKAQGLTELQGRGYNTTDDPTVASLGGASGYLSVLVLILYVNSPEVLLLHRRPAFLWLICPILMYWVGRIWILTTRGAMHDDPIVFALKDKASIAAGAAAAACMVAAA